MKMHGHFSIAFVIFFSSLCIAAQKKILITAFEPFGFSTTNNSLDSASSAKKNLELDGFTVEICVLPVVYDLAAINAKKCYDSSDPKPSMVLSLGEGDCSLRLETAAHNRDSSPGFPDNSGNIRNGSVIAPEIDSSISFRSFVADMYCSAPEEVKKLIRVSESPGGFVCNNTALHLGHYFAKLNVPYTFIHVPHSECRKENNLIRDSGQQISKMIQSLTFFKAKASSESFEDICQQLPLSVKKIEEYHEIIDIVDAGSKNQCSKEFLQKLKERLMQWKEKKSTY